MSGKRWTERDGGAVGQTLPLVAIFMMSLLLAAGLTIDIGNAYRVKQSLQASADATSAAGAGKPAESRRGRRRGELVRLGAGRQEPDPGQPAMQQIATPGNYFYQPQPTQLVGVSDAITADLAKGTSRINGRSAFVPRPRPSHPPTLTGPRLRWGFDPLPNRFVRSCE